MSTYLVALEVVQPGSHQRLPEDVVLPLPGFDARLPGGLVGSIWGVKIAAFGNLGSVSFNMWKLRLCTLHT